jgi:hypothetical protein
MTPRQILLVGWAGFLLYAWPGFMSFDSIYQLQESRSGYFTVATALRAHFEAHGPWDAAALQRLHAAECARVFGQQDAGAAAGELMALFATALVDLGRLLARRYGGRFETLVGASEQRAATLVERLAEMPFSHATHATRALQCPSTRAQITGLALALVRRPGRFVDRERLTIFADNLVLHVLRRDGVPSTTPAPLARIEAGHEIESGSAEVEIRALALHAVERCVEQLRRDGVEVRAEQLTTGSAARPEPRDEGGAAPPHPQCLLPRRGAGAGAGFDAGAGTGIGVTSSSRASTSARRDVGVTHGVQSPSASADASCSRSSPCGSASSSCAMRVPMRVSAGRSAPSRSGSVSGDS